MNEDFVLELALPISIPPRGLSRVQAAEYIGVSPATFDKMVADRRMPGPLRINARTVWDRRSLDREFERLNTSSAEDGDDTWASPEV